LNRSGFTALDINPSSTKVVFLTWWQDGFGMGTTYSKEVRLYDLSAGKQLPSIKTDGSVRTIAFNKEKGELIDAATTGGTYTYKQSGEFVAWNNKRSYESDLNLENGRGSIRWTPNYLRYTGVGQFQKKQLLFAGNIVNAAAFEDQNLLIALANTNEISFYDLSSFEKRLNIVSKKNNEWVAYAPSGDFISSANGTDKVLWIIGDQYLPLAMKPPTMKPPTMKPPTKSISE
jgi:hypothetical protein